ncbi:membrane protein [Marivirga lumbricoides]|uniref:Membrane protein n=1 Tax=Marivirga lumbricoides TaxID=1046115 RepID=A0ABQ1MWI3_9BACT|nr:membrane protein [Marivirga lumbricoides]
MKNVLGQNYKINKQILPIIVLAQFCCTSVWFAGNAIISDLIVNFDLVSTALGHLTSSIQLGFIFGTLIFALLAIADKFSPSKVFLFSATIAAALNCSVTFPGNSYLSLVGLRFLTGICLAGIYPVGMKIAADYFDKGLGKSLGFLVGALVLGTAFPHLLNSLGSDFNWQYIIYATSALAFLGGLLIFAFVPDGPYRKSGQGLKIGALITVFKPKAFRAAAFGYFGHMWELYTFWAFVPLLLLSHSEYNGYEPKNISLFSFVIIAIGALGCVLAGYLAEKLTARKVAFSALSLSGICCILIPVVFLYAGSTTLTGFLVIWGIAVTADSPLFSTMVAQNAIAEFKGSALTIVNCIGFAITIVSLQLVNFLNIYFELYYILPVLALGPFLGLFYKKVGEK